MQRVIAYKYPTSVLPLGEIAILSACPFIIHDVTLFELRLPVSIDNVSPDSTGHDLYQTSLLQV